MTKRRKWGVSTSDWELDGLPMRSYWTNSPRHGVVLYLHGGGFVAGGLEVADETCREIAGRTNLPLVSVAYRLAPEHPFPAAVEDCWKSLSHVAAQLPGPLVIAGDSAGGNLAAVECLRARDRGGPDIALQVLIYPMVDGRLTAASIDSESEPGFGRPELEMVRTHYLPEGDVTQPEISPLLAPDHRGLPPALIITADHDPLRDDGLAYAKALESAGVGVTYTNYAGVAHAFLGLNRLRVARRAADEIVQAILEASNG